MRRPSGLLVKRETQLAVRPRRATPTAVLSSAPPANISRLVACSSRRKPGGCRRIIDSPNVTTSTGMIFLFSSGLFNDGDILAGQFADAIEISFRDRPGFDQLPAHAQATGAGFQERGGRRQIDAARGHEADLRQGITQGLEEGRPHDFRWKNFDK